MHASERPASWLAEEPTLSELPRCGLCEMSPADGCDPVLAAYRQDVDRTLLRENLKLTPAQRAEKFTAFMRFVGELRGVGTRARPSTPGAPTMRNSFKYRRKAFGVRCRCVTLERLIQLKRAAGRPKDLEAIAELEALAEERSRSQA